LERVAEGSCFIRCVAVSLKQKVGMGAKAIYAVGGTAPAGQRDSADIAVR
jgi:hypothetical protein